MVQFKLTITKWTALSIILALTSIMIIDSTIVKYFAFNIKELPTPMYSSIFLTLTILFVVIVAVLLLFIMDKDLSSRFKHSVATKSSYFVILLTQSALIIILFIIVQLTVLLRSYNIISLMAAVYISHICALFFLIYLTITLVLWIRSKKNNVLSLYAISFTLTAVAIVSSLIYAIYTLSFQPSHIRPSSIHHSLLALPGSYLANYFGTTLDVISIISFVSVWVASAVILKTYSNRLGKIKYWTIISIPLIYFLFPFETYFLNIFSSYVIESPVEYGIINLLIFSATKQIGALFFSIAFFAASTLVSNNELKKYLLITAIGIAILFGSIEIDTLLYATYPPFGLVTISFMPIGAYLVFTGITLSATLLARDKQLRSEFYNTAISQLALLKTIGVREMEKELIKTYKSVEKRSKLDTKVEILDDAVHDLDKEDVREILHEVLTELYSKPRNKDKP